MVELLNDGKSCVCETFKGQGNCKYCFQVVDGSGRTQKEIDSKLGLESGCEWCKRATNPEYYSSRCACGSIFGVHKARHPHPYIGDKPCEGFSPESGLIGSSDCICKDSGICGAKTHSCVCLDYGSQWCRAEHSLTVVEEGVMGETKCPICRTSCIIWDDPPDVSCCIDCDIEFRTSDGTIIEFHSAALDTIDQLYKCNHCQFQTINLQEKLKHEQDTPPVLIGKASDAINQKTGKQLTKTIGSKDEKKEELHYCEFNSNDGKQPRWKCKYCDWKGDTYVGHENEAGRKANGMSNYTPVKHCSHPPRHIIDGGKEGWGVWAGRKWDCEDQLKDFDIFLNLSGTRVSKRHHLPRELRKWEGSIGNCQEYTIDWPDFGIVNFPRQFWVDLVELLKEKKAKMLVCCVGGHGRTGTACCCLMTVGLGWTATEALNWLWTEVCDQLVESQVQLEYCYHIAGEKMPKLKEDKKKGQPAQYVLMGD